MKEFVSSMKFFLNGRLGKLAGLLALGLVSGACGFGFLVFVNEAARLLLEGNLEANRPEMVVAVAVLVVLFFLSRRFLAIGLIDWSLDVLWGFRQQVIRLAMRTSFQIFQAKKATIYSALVHDINTLTNASMTVVDFGTSLIIIVGCLAYLAWLSLPLFGACLGMILVAALIYHFSNGRNHLRFGRARDYEDEFIRQFNAVIDGFKEIRIAPEKGTELYDQKIKTVARNSVQDSRSAYIGFLNNQMIGQVSFYLLIASLLLFFGVELNESPATIVGVIFTMMFILGPIETVMVLLPGLSRAGIAANRMMKLHEDLKMNSSESESATMALEDFQQLKLDGLAFSYNGSDEAFAIGPLGMELRSGEIVFLKGGNGSGKTTFVMALLGLLVARSGRFFLNNEEIPIEKWHCHKTLFASVFSDFYLFEELYGVKDLDPTEFDFWVETFEMTGKVRLEGHRFSTTSMSTGQRKRLALIHAILEKRPILVLDEWAADQDPQFRQKFYTEILPLLKSKGYAILAISHDDKYFAAADRIYEMDFGKMRSAEPLIQLGR